MNAPSGDNPAPLEMATRRRLAAATRTRVACLALALLAPSLGVAAVAGAAAAAPAPATAVVAGSEATSSIVGKTGPLKVEARIKVPLAAGATFVGAEAPDGAVFLAQVGGVKTTVVWVVDGDGPAAVAEHVTGAVQALAAGSKNLYIVTDKMLVAFNRATGDQIGHWALPKTSRANTSDAQLISISGSNGTVLVLATRNNDVDIYRINSASTSGPRLVAVGTSAAFGPAGSVYYRVPTTTSLIWRRPASPPSVPSWPTIPTALVAACSLSTPWPAASFGWTSLLARASMRPSAAMTSEP